MLAALRFGRRVCRARRRCGNGHWQIAATDASTRRSRRYRGNTLILETELVTADGTATLIEFMPLRAQGTSHIVRIVQGRRGRVAMHTRLMLRFDYGSVVPWVTRLDDNTIKAIAGPDMAVLRTTVDLKADGFSHRARFSVAAGETATFVLGYGPSFARLARTYRAACRPRRDRGGLGRMGGGATGRRQIRRGGAALADHAQGAHLPSDRRHRRRAHHLAAGKARRDCATGTTATVGCATPRFTLLALMNCGFDGEAEAWRTGCCTPSPAIRRRCRSCMAWPANGASTSGRLHGLGGYEGAKPVRIGNAAAKQLQLDIFGEVMDALYQSADGGWRPRAPSGTCKCELVEHLETIWQEPDRGHLGSARRPAAFHPLQGDGLGRVRPRRQEDRKFGLEGPLDALAQAARANPRRGL